MKAKRSRLSIAGLALVIAGLAVFAAIDYAAGRVAHPWVQEYAAGEGNIRGGVDAVRFLEIDERFEIGADEDGWAVFKDPAAALGALEEKYGQGLRAIQREFGLMPVKWDAQSYKTYGWQVTTGTPEEREQARFVTQFMDIYENSF